MDYRVVRLIIDYPIKFAKERISDPEDFRPTRIRYFAAFVPKSAGNEWQKSDKLNTESKYDTSNEVKQEEEKVYS
jgi:hypothetical protein